MSFKEMVLQDAQLVFLNLEEFGELHHIAGKEIVAIVDDNEMIEREKRQKTNTDGLYQKQMLLYVLASEFGRLPAVGRTLEVDGKTYLVTDAVSEDGIYSISLEANRS